MEYYIANKIMFKAKKCLCYNGYEEKSQNYLKTRPQLYF